MTSIYERIGGEAAMDAAVDLFYRKVLADDRVSGFFDGIDMQDQAAKQKAFLTMATGGPNQYTGKELREGHKHVKDKDGNGINDEHVTIIIEHAGAALKELGVPDGEIGEIAALLESVRNDVTNS